MLNIFPPDPCCLKRFQKAAVADDTESWTCPKCHCEWKSTVVVSVKKWEPVTVIGVWPMRQT